MAIFRHRGPVSPLLRSSEGSIRTCPHFIDVDMEAQRGSELTWGPGEDVGRY
jgi:hypothetical protein